MLVFIIFMRWTHAFVGISLYWYQKLDYINISDISKEASIEHLWSEPYRLTYNKSIQTHTTSNAFIKNNMMIHKAQ